MRISRMLILRLGFVLLSVGPGSHPSSTSAAAEAGTQQDEASQTDGEPPATAKPELPSQGELDARFEKLLSGSQLIGFFTVSGTEKDKPLQEDKYTIEKVKKLKNDYWLFEARIQYDNKDQKFPMPLEVKWAGDTPMITMTKVFVPGMGTFSARVLFYGDEYAGTWSAGDHGGHMFGRVVKPDAAASETKPPAGEANDAK